MSQHWYYSKGDQRHGPITGEQLKKLAMAGELQDSDLVWREGMAQWVEAQKIKGLFPIPEIAPPQAPPPLPVTPPAVPAVPAVCTPASSPASAPPLWNPRSLSAMGFLFSWAFGAYILAQNWKALGDEANAKRAMVWFYSFFPFLLLAFLLADTPLAPKGVWFASLAVLAALYWLEIRPQITFVKERFANQFPHKSWWKPIGIALLACLVVGGVLGMFGDESNVSLVKKGHLEAYPDVPIGEAVDKFLADPQWEAVEDRNGREYVTVRGGAEFRGRPVEVALQFRVNPDSGRFKVHALEIDGRPQNQLVTIGLLSKIFDDEL